MATTTSGIYYRTNGEAAATSEAQSLSLANSVDTAVGLIPRVPTSVNVSAGTATVDSSGVVTLTNATNISLNGVFSSSFKHYRVLLEIQTASAVPGGAIRLRAAGTDASSANYSWMGYRAINWAGAAGLNGTSSGSDWGIWDTYSGPTVGAVSIDVMRPADATFTKYVSSGYHASNALGSSYYNGHHSVNTAYDGITYTTSVAVTGTFRVLAYR